MGIERPRLLTRDFVFWKSMNANIEKLIHEYSVHLNVKTLNLKTLYYHMLYPEDHGKYWVLTYFSLKISYFVM